MRLQFLLPKVEPKALPIPSKCAYADCASKQMHQEVEKALRDTMHQQVTLLPREVHVFAKMRFACVGRLG